MKFVKNKEKQTLKSVKGLKKTPGVTGSLMKAPKSRGSFFKDGTNSEIKIRKALNETQGPERDTLVKRRWSVPSGKNELETPLKKFKQQSLHSKGRIKARGSYSSADNWVEIPVEQDKIELILPTKTTENIKENNENDEGPTEVADDESSSTEKSEESDTFSSEDDNTSNDKIEDADDGNSSTEERASGEDDNTSNTIEGGSDDGSSSTGNGSLVEDDDPSNNKVENATVSSSTETWGENVPLQSESLKRAGLSMFSGTLNLNVLDSSASAEKKGKKRRQSEESDTFSSEDDNSASDRVEDTDDGNSSTEERASGEDDNTSNMIEGSSDDGSSTGNENSIEDDDPLPTEKQGKKPKQSNLVKRLYEGDISVLDRLEDKVKKLINTKKRTSAQRKLMGKYLKCMGFVGKTKIGDTSFFTKKASDKFEKASDKIEKASDKVEKASNKIKKASHKNEKASDKIEKISDKVEKASHKDEKAPDKVEKASDKIKEISDKVEKASNKIKKASHKNEKASDKFEKASDKVEKASDKIEKASHKDEKASDKNENANVSGENAKRKVGETGKKNRYVLFVGNLPYTIDHYQITEHFKRAGKVVSVRIPTDKETNQGRGFAFIELTNKESYEKALSLHHTFVAGRRINVHYTNSKERENVPAKKSVKAKNLKLTEMRKRGLLAGSVKESQKRSARRAKKKKATDNQGQK